APPLHRRARGPHRRARARPHRRVGLSRVAARLGRALRGDVARAGACRIAERMSCVFCQDVHRAGEVIAEGTRLWAVLHEDWAVRGHTMIVWKQHVENVADLALEDWLHFAATHHRVERALLEATGAARAVILKLGIATPHLHVHVYPVPASLD